MQKAYKNGYGNKAVYEISVQTNDVQSCQEETAMLSDILSWTLGL